MTLLRHTDPKFKGNLLVVDRFDGMRVDEGDLRQCAHCQRLWTFRMGSGFLRGYCFKCMGHLCGQRACMDCYPAEQRVEDSEEMFKNSKQAFEAVIRHRNWLEKVFN